MSTALFLSITRHVCNLASRLPTYPAYPIKSTVKSISTLIPTERLSLFKELVNNDEVNFIKKLYSDAGHEIRIAGGAVRDILSGKLPHDIDFATTATPDESKALLSNRNNVRLILTKAGERHGTVTALINRKSEFEITTLRCDIVTDGRHAEVEFIKDWKMDAERRDLTFNAMFLTLDGELIDFYNGAEDLRKGRVKFVGDAQKRIEEDHLRILRFFRFWSRYGLGRPDEQTLKILSEQIAKGGLDHLSGERIWSELKRIFEHMPCLNVVKLMLELRLFYKLGVHDLDTKVDLEKIDANQYDKYSREVLEDLAIVQQRLLALKEKALHNNNATGAYEPIVPFATLIRSEKQQINAHSRMKWSNFERDLITYVLANKNPGTLDSYKSELALCPKTKRSIIMKQLVEYMKYCGQIDQIDELENWPIPEFPVDTRIIIDAMPPEKRAKGTGIKTLLEDLKLEWAKSGYSITQEDVMKSVEIRTSTPK